MRRKENYAWNQGFAKYFQDEGLDKFSTTHHFLDAALSERAGTTVGLVVQPIGKVVTSG